MSTDGYLAFLLCGILLVLLDGQILYRSGLRYLGNTYQPESARSVMQLVTVLFHLVVLGVLALISTINVTSELPIRDLVVKLGVVLLTLGVAHGVTMAILAAVRSKRREEQIIEDKTGPSHSIASPRDTGNLPTGPSSTGYSA